MTVRLQLFLNMLSKRAPLIVVLSLCAALVGAWASAPAGLIDALTIIVGSLTIMLLAARGRRRSLMSLSEESDLPSLKDRIEYELAGKGTPPGHYLLGFFGFLTIMLTGLQSPSGMLACAGTALVVVWGIVNARYPAD